MSDLFDEDLLGLDTEADLLINRIFDLPINYVGNKKRLLRSIAMFLAEQKLEYRSVLDAFSGSGVVSCMFSGMGKDVISNDLLSFSSLAAVELLETRCVPIADGDVVTLCNSDPMTGPGFISSSHPDFFLKEEALFLDNYRENVAVYHAGDEGSVYTGMTIESGNIVPRMIPLNSRSKPITKANKTAASFSMYVICNQIMQRCFLGGRYYKGQTLSRLDKRLERDPEVTVMTGIARALSPRTSPFAKIYNGMAFKGKSQVFNCDIINLLSSGLVAADLVYIDPPYGGESSDYACLYRLCEEYIHGKKLEDIFENSSPHRFKGKKRYEENFSKLLELCLPFPNWLISFNASSYDSIEGIEKQVKRFRKNVVVKVADKDYVYNYRKDSHASQRESEYLILARS